MKRASVSQGERGSGMAAFWPFFSLFVALPARARLAVAVVVARDSETDGLFSQCSAACGSASRAWA